MKKLKIAALLTLLGACFFGQSARAQTSYTNGDLLLGFRSSSGSLTQDIVIDIGQAVYTTPAGQTITIGNYSSDLSNTFTSGWFTSGKTKWGVISADLGSAPAETLYVGKPESTFGNQVNPGSSYAPDTSGNQTGTVGNEESVALAFENATAFGSAPNSAIQNDSDANSWFSQSSVSPAFGAYSGFEGTLPATGLNGTSLDLFEIIPTDEGGGASPIYEGRFVIASTGVVTYTAAGTVPEPSAFTALAGGAGLLGLIRRRRASTTL